MTMSQEEMLRALEEVFQTLQDGGSEIVSRSPAGTPHASDAYYARLSSQLVSIVRGDPSSAGARVFMFRILPLIEENVTERRAKAINARKLA